MSTGGSVGRLLNVHLRAFPVDVWFRTQQHTDGLLREFTLIAEQTAGSPDQHGSVPTRLVQLVDELSAGYGEFGAEQETQLFAAVGQGVDVIDDLTYRIPAAVGPAAQHLGDLLDEADEYCRGGQHLLSLATPEESVRFRRWFLAEFVNQAAGQPATPWTP